MASLLRILTSEPLAHNVNQLRFISTASSLLTSLTTNHKKSRHVLSLLRTENNPDRILEICRSASLSPHHNHHLHRVAFSLAVATLSSQKHLSAVSHLLDGFINSQPHPRSESSAVRAIILYGRANMLDRSLQTFHNLERYEIQRTVKSLNALLLACLTARDYEEAKRVYSETPRKYGIEPDLETYNRIVKALCESNSTSSSYSIVAEMERRRVKPRASTFGLMIAGFYKEGKYDEVRRVLRLMREFGVHVGIATYNIMVRCLCEGKRSREAKALLCGVVSSRMRPNSETYSILIRGFCGEGDLDEAMGVFEVMVKSGCKPGSECYFGLIRCLCERGEFETALVLCKESMEKNWVPSFSVMRWLVHGLVGCDKVDEAREVIALVKEKFSRNVDLWNEVEAELP
ncbi:Pentatricopeptide repeat-containing protein [Raphanus sativus]|uniref:Pentatricopeptide repeat-containing protein At1g11630, mitochondrial-like n=1 Tax=Raphanus sativus TaxID=3726 RepID=A0A9W3CXW0_RAPSA|nr:pentatricopeptide repeat-containing protein At1g11630, mitochondrial-like [Raphanus sativus]KAJ4867734.1 Pentatricopeptide repeat-containing protein [Raphanus sativus]